MRFQYSTNDPSQSKLDSLPRLPLTLRLDHKVIKVRSLSLKSIEVYEVVIFLE
jgi:hypothetical protein